MLFYHRSIDETYDSLRSGPDGLSRHESETRLASHGLNILKINTEPLWRIVIEPFRSVFMLVLFVAAVISFIQKVPIDGIIVLSIMMISALIYYTQRFSTEKILRSLQKRSSQSVEVIRHKEIVHIDATLLVPGDVVILREGDKVPADIRLTSANGVKADEAMLTGESVAVDKNSETLGDKKEIYEQRNMLFQGTFLVSGSATGIVVFTGNETEFGRIAALTKKSSDSSVSPVQKKIDRLLSLIIAVVAGTAIVAFVLALIRGVEFTEAIRFVLAMTVSAVPEGLPVAISVILVLGMRRMSAKKALVRTMKAIETIGVITTIASDKTGTLTENKLSVQETWQLEGTSHHLPTIAQRSVNHEPNQRTDPLDTAISQFTNGEALIEYKGNIESILPFDQAFAMSGNVWHHKGRYDLIVKGAPEQILDKSSLTKKQLTESEQALARLTALGYRVIALAATELTIPVNAFQDMHAKQRLEFVGFIAVADSLRPTVKHAITTALNAGVSVRMITGDHFETAYAIGKQLGLVSSRDEVFDSRLMNDMTAKQIKQRITNATVFSRVTPENKFKILQILKVTEVVAMTGDGVNDVPAVSNADVGIAMGSGSQIAKDAGDIILLNNDFGSIVAAMKEGRIVFANIRRMLFYLLSSNTAEVLIMVVALIIGLPLPLLPVQILWVNLVSETTVVIPLGLEPGERSIMKNRPISPTAPLLSRYMISRIVLVAVTMSALCLGLFGYFYSQYGVAYGQTIVFTSIVVMVWANAFNARSTYESAFTRLRVWNGGLFVGLGASVVLQLLAVFGPFQGILHIHPIAIGDLFISSIISFAVIILVVEVHKFIGRRLRFVTAK
ncbi:MAG: cation-transporting P-type ATPase [Candidatus Microsaccharimonas sp.]